MTLLRNPRRAQDEREQSPRPVRQRTTIAGVGSASTTRGGRWLAGGLVVSLWLAAGCRAEAASPPSETAAKPEAVKPAAAQVAPSAYGLKVVARGFSQPLLLVTAPTGVRYVVEQTGSVWALNASGERAAKPFLEWKEQLHSSRGEMGLLGLAFHPRYPADPRVFVAYSKRAPAGSQAKLLDAVSSFVVDVKAGVVDRGTERALFEIPDPAGNHNGGMLVFGPDGYLYIGTGDGGAANDKFRTARDPSSLLAKMLRVDVDVLKDHKGPAYRVPKDNPFVAKKGTRPEVWATGLRNPWRYSFDRTTGDLWIADVGQNKYEEVHWQKKASRGGEDYGWSVMEGDRCFQAKRCDKAGLTMPVHVYDHDEGCSVTGGYVYRGKKHEALVGDYIFSDYCTGTIWALRRDKKGAFSRRTLFDTDRNVSSFGEDAEGEIYVVDHGKGEVLQLVATP